MYDDIKSDLYFPKTGENGCSIEWESSNEELVTTDGKVIRPPFLPTMGEGVLVTVTATISKGEASTQKSFPMYVTPSSPTYLDSVAADKTLLTYDVLLNENTSADDVKSRLNLITETPRRWSMAGYYGECTITWESSNPDIIAADGTVTRPPMNAGNQNVTLTATISKDDYYIQRPLRLSSVKGRIFCWR